ncbi:MAG: EF-P lysine aminoacylase GenX [Chitinispirillaceae bacterium]|nr:EF-P lysine aminoacylase GenX [Chitinispirillaceae bacterium]
MKEKSARQFTVETARARAEMMSMIRAFFSSRDVLEVETPILGCTASTDCHIDLFSSSYLSSGSTDRCTGEKCYLQTSPELFMKRLLVGGFPDIFQIGKVFRNGELGRLHNPEFTMLEWYRRGFDMFRLIDETVELLRDLSEIETVRVLTYRDLFLQSTGLDPLEVGIGDMESFIGRESGQQIRFGTVTEGLQFVMAAVVEPALPKNELTVLHHYPREQAVLSMVDPDDTRVARRFEVYGGGMELANGFEELADSTENRRRMNLENMLRNRCGKPEVPLDECFLAALNEGGGLPPCSGVAVGLDRVFMCRLGVSAITEVVSFGWKER